MLDEPLPPLPEPMHGFYATPLFSMEQMRAYAAQAVADLRVELAANAELCRLNEQSRYL